MFLARRAVAPIVVGEAAGVGLSMTTARLLRDQLYGVTPGDLTTLGVVAAVLLTVSVVAVCIPSWRAMRASPARALVG